MNIHQTVPPLRLHLFREMWQAFPCLLPEVRCIRMRSVRDSEAETEEPGDGGRCRTQGVQPLQKTASTILLL